MATVDEKMVHVFGGSPRTAARLEKANSLCPFPILTAYWTPPPAWARRLCDNKLISFTMNRSCWIATAAILLTYFAIMDIFLFARFRTVNLVSEGKPGQPGELYSPFTHLSVKAVISDHVRHYLFTPSAEYFNTFTHFTKIFTFITPNMVSSFHLICAFISGKFIASENFHDRRIGVVIYIFRTWLDSLDGIVYRDHAGRYLQYNSVYSSFGYIVDALFDTLGGFFLSFGVLFYLFKRFGPESTTDLPMWSKSSDFSPEGSTATGSHVTAVVVRREMHSYRYLFFKTVTYGLSLAVAGICWDRAVKGFTEVFQVDMSDPSLAKLQSDLSHSTITLVIFFTWRFISGQTVLNYMLVAIYMDKIWEFLKYTPWIILVCTLPLHIITTMYIINIRYQLQL